MAASTNLWKLAGHPSNPMGDITHSNWPRPGTENAVKCWDSGVRGICQKPEVRSNVLKIVDPALPMSPMHSDTSFIEYLSSWLLALRALKSCTTLRLPSFLGTKNMGLLYRLREGCITPSFSHSWIWVCKSCLWASGISYCLRKIGSLLFISIWCSKLFALPRSFLSLLKISWFARINSSYSLRSVSGTFKFNFSKNAFRSASLSGAGLGVSRFSSISHNFAPSKGVNVSWWMFSNSPILVPLGISMSTGPQFCTNTVTCPAWLGTTSPGPPLSSGKSVHCTVAIERMFGPGLCDPVRVESCIGMVAYAGIVSVDKVDIEAIVNLGESVSKINSRFLEL